MAELAEAESFLQEHHVKTTTWHLVLNNTTSTKPKDHGGPVVPAISKLKQYETCGSGSASPMVRCILRLPNSFVKGDGKVLEVEGLGATQNEASEDACCGAMVKLLRAEPGNVLLRRGHWTIPAAELIKGLLKITGEEQSGTEHQPLVVRRGRGGPPVETLTGDDNKKAVEEVIRRCLESHGVAFDPAMISRQRYGLQPGEVPPWETLHSLLGKGELLQFVSQHPDFQYSQDGPKGMFITWATCNAQGASAGHQDQALPVQEGGATSSGSTPNQPGASAGHQDQALPVQEDGATSSGSTANKIQETKVGQALPSQSFYSFRERSTNQALPVDHQGVKSWLDM